MIILNKKYKKGKIMAFNKVRYDNNYQKENYDRIILNVPKGEREKIKKHAILKGYNNTTEYIRELIKNDMNEKNDKEL